MSGSSSDLIQLRMKLIGNRVVVSGQKEVAKSTEGIAKSTDKLATKQRYAERSTSRLTSSYKKLGTAAKWGLGFLGVGGVLAVESSIHASEELAKTTAGLTRNFGLQNNVASRWAAVASSREIDSKALSMGFGTLSTKMVEAARKGGTALTPFHQLGISQEEVARGAKDFQWGLLRVTQALGEEEGGAKRSAAAKGVLGKGYLTLGPLMADGVKGLREQLHWADKYGVTLSGSTTDGLMEMVSAQRENKVAMLGLQLSLTKALTPAIEAGDEQLQEFIATLNDPHLTKEQKISRISHQFLMLEDDLVKIIAKAIPHIAEEGGHLGVALAGAVWHGFEHSDTLGKFVIGGWLFKSMGGFGAIGGAGAKVGGKLARSLGWTFLATVAPYFAAEGGVEGFGSAVNTRMASMKPVFSRWGGRLGVALAVGFVTFGLSDARTRNSLIEFGNHLGAMAVEGLGGTINKGIDLVNEAFDEANAFAFLGVDAPHIGHVGDLGGLVMGAGPIGGSPTGVLGQGSDHGSFLTPEGGGHHRHRHPVHPTPHASKRPAQRSHRRAEMQLMPRGAGGSRRLVIHNHLHADGREFAELVTEHALDAAALA